jgi:hypothetical protein
VNVESNQGNHKQNDVEEIDQSHNIQPIKLLANCQVKLQEAQFSLNQQVNIAQSQGLCFQKQQSQTMKPNSIFGFLSSNVQYLT